MNLYFDTSALVKKYIHEKGTEKVDGLMNDAGNVIVSAITSIEVYSTFKRLLTEKAIDSKEYKFLIDEFEFDNQFYTRIDIDDLITENAKMMIEKYQLKSLDSVQLGTALSLKDEIDYFIVCDDKIIKSGKKEGLNIINPID
jgi:predicted nucleic acid-binding protein